MSPRHWTVLPALALTAGMIAGAILVAPRALAEDAVRIATWSGDRAGAFAYTFDDGIRDQVALAVPMLDALGLKATFAINPGKTSTTNNFGSGTWDDWRTLARNGHEIANHSQTHPNLGQVTDVMMLEKEIIGAKTIIEQEIGQRCITFVYPFNVESEASRMVVKKSHIAWTGGERKTYGGPTFTAAKANAWIDEAISKKILLIAMIHGIEKGYLPFTGRAVFKEHLAYAKSKEDQVWIAPLGTIKRYEVERSAASLMITKGTRKCAISLTTTLDPVVYNVPLTIVITAGSAKTVSAKRSGGGECMAVIRGEQILCEIVPGQGEVTVTWK